MPSRSLLGIVVCMGLSGVAFAAEEVADQVILKDGKVVHGDVREATGRSVSIVVRRDWARKNLPDWLKRWEAIEKAAVARAVKTRTDRLLAWKRDRSIPPVLPASVDRITPWIDRELSRLQKPGEAASTPLIAPRILLGDYIKVVRRPKSTDGLLREAWRSRLSEPESKSAEELRGLLEGRGFDVSKPLAAPLDALLPVESEPEHRWLLRRAATEVSFDPNLRLLMYQGLLMVEPGNGGGNPAVPALQALPALGALLGAPQQGDQLAGRLRLLGAWGRVGALVTRLDIASDFSAVQVELTMMVRQGSGSNQWQSAGSRSARIRTDQLGPDAGKELAQDPQVATAFQLLEAVGLRELGPELKRRSLAVGAATREALGRARTEAEADVARLVLPVLEGQNTEPSPAAAP